MVTSVPKEPVHNGENVQGGASTDDCTRQKCEWVAVRRRVHQGLLERFEECDGATWHGSRHQGHDDRMAVNNAVAVTIVPCTPVTSVNTSQDVADTDDHGFQNGN